MIEKYSVPMRMLHWVIALMILSLLAMGFYMTSLASDAPNKYDLYPLHKALGFVVLILVMVRLLVRAATRTPPPLKSLQAWEIKLSQWVHVLLYVAMIAMTWSGFMMNTFFAYAEGLDVFGLFTVPDLFAKSEYWNGVFHQIHSITAWSFLVLLGLHIGGALKHRFLDTKAADVLPRMM